MANKWVYFLEAVGQDKALMGQGQEALSSLLGGKGARLAEMTRIGLPVPPAFTVTTEACLAYLSDSGSFPEGMWEQMLEALKQLEAKTGKFFGDPSNPLLVSCRSGAKFSMPGMMDTVLNIGLNDQTARGMVDLTGDERFVYDSYRRLVQMFGSVALGIGDEPFEAALDDLIKKEGFSSQSDLRAGDWKELVGTFQQLVKQEKGFDFPQDPLEQLRLAAKAVFRSWNGRRAVDYRNAARIPHDLGTAVNVVAMVFGNLGKDSGTGVAFTRDPSTGASVLYGDYLLDAQGEDVVAGIRNTKWIRELEQDMPAVYGEFVEICQRLERHYRDMQDVEFTIERGKLWMLQTRSGKRTAKAGVRIAVDMANEGLISKKEALLRVDPSEVDTLLHPTFDPKVKQQAISEGRLFAKGVNASPGAAVGMVTFDADTTQAWAKGGRDVIMVRPFTKPDDVHGMLAAKGILTTEGGATSHAAVVARQFGVPCVVGASGISIDLDKRLMTSGERVLRDGDWLSLDGTTGEALLDPIPLAQPRFDEQEALLTLLSWADEHRKLQIWANADYAEDAARARTFGAEGIGLCRTEHMFFEDGRLPIVQKMILAKNRKERERWLSELLPLQRSDFEGILRAMDGLPVIVRLLDPPLHEFLPNERELAEEVVAKRFQDNNLDLPGLETLLVSVEGMREVNPMMGLRGVRLSILMPEIVAMQVRAFFEAACNVAKEGKVVRPEVMIPLVGHVRELETIQPLLQEVAKAVMQEKEIEIPYKFGTMIEVPRAAISAGEVARVAEFFSFGTNDLTQMTFGFSRDDAEAHFLLAYVERGILPVNPFQSIDQAGVGELVKMGVEKGRAARPDLQIGVCGEHGGDPESIEFFHSLDVDYVSCSSFRVPVARLAAARAALRSSQEQEFA